VIGRESAHQEAGAPVVAVKRGDGPAVGQHPPVRLLGPVGAGAIAGRGKGLPAIEALHPSDEVIAFAPDIQPLYVDPEELIPYFPDAPLLEIGEFIHVYSQEIKEIFSLLDTDDGSSLSFTALEYIKAATACELSRVYGGGGDDELSVRLGDLSITNRNLPRSTLTRANATTWCQIAATLRKEILAQKVSARAIQPKGLPTMPTISSGRAVDPYTGSTIYLSDKDIYGPGAIITPKENPIPERGLRKHD